MKILMVHPVPGDATNFYRLGGPLAHLSKHYPLIEVIDGDKMEFSWQKMLQCDIVYMGRPSTMDSLQIIRIAKRMKKPVISDYDDQYLEIPQTNPRAELYGDYGRQLVIKDCMRESDVIVASTEAIKKSILNAAPKADVRVIPNGYDPDLFELPNKRNQNKIVLYRGGDTHVNDLLLHKEQILKCFFDFPEYTWAFMGHVPLWLTEHPGVPDTRLRLYGFEDLMIYFNLLMELRPEIAIVPLEDNLFNHGKSNLAFIEATLAGAITVAPKFLPEFNQPGMIHYETYNDLYNAFTFAVNCNQDGYYEVSKGSVPSLADVNKKRALLISELHVKNRFKPFVTDVKSVEPLGQKEFFDYAYEHQWTQEHEQYKKAHYNVGQWLIDTINPDRVIEFGCGPGAMLEKFHLEQVHALGVEYNPHFIDYFRKRNPNTAHLIIQGDLTDTLQFPQKYDLGVSIEVFEHIDMSDEKWDNMIRGMAKNIRWFYFSSTPYRADMVHDAQWGHINLRRFEKWKELFGKNGWEFQSNPSQITSWDILFKSTLFDTVEP